ncbi:MAG TPA: hypothetical protein VKU62_06105, partial [Thermoanaerobaculia bacterium]|nr:hypothetical protein [Thermoanaerobaculia bacterium]
MIVLLAIVWAQTRIASDFELQQMQRLIERARDFPSQLSAHLNLGDLRQARNEPDLGRTEYQKALEIASNERTEARKAGDLTRYATATSYAALSEAKLCGSGTTDRSVCATHAFALAEEAMRYSSDSAKSWNLYATTMAALHLTAKAASAARNAGALEKDPLDLAIYKYTLASSLDDSPASVRAGFSRPPESGPHTEAEELFVEVIQSLRSPQFDELRRQVARTESFEIYSSARGDVAAYVSTLNRAQLRLAALYERRGDLANAKQQYANVLADRTDDPIALAAIARLEPSEEHFKAAFDANPFSLSLIRDYQMNLSLGRGRREAAGEGTVGDKVRLAVEQMQRGEYPAAIVTITIVEKQFPNNATLAALRRDIDEKRKAFLARFDN